MGKFCKELTDEQEQFLIQIFNEEREKLKSVDLIRRRVIHGIIDAEIKEDIQKRKKILIRD